MEQQHLVQKFTFDVGFDSEEKSFEFQNRLAAFAKEHILALTEEIFTELGGNHSIRINKIELDLGEIPLDGFEEEAYYRFREKLKDKLKLLLKGYSTSDTEEKIEFISKAESELELLRHFLTYGTLPWTARKNDPDFSVNKLLANLIESHPVILKKYLSENINNSEFRKRIIRQIEDEVLWSVIMLMTKSEETILKRFYTETTNLYRKRNFIINTLSEFRELIWNFIITYSIIQKKTVSELSIILDSFIHFIPTYISASIEKVIQSVYLALSDSPTFTSSLEHVFSDQKIPVTLEDSFVKFIKRESVAIKVIEDLKKKESNVISNKDKNKDKDKSVEDSNSQEASLSEESFEEQLRKRREEQAKQREQRVYNFLVEFFEWAAFGIQREFTNEELEEVERLIKEFAVANPILLRRVIADSKFRIEEIAAKKFLSGFNEDVLEILLPEIFKINVAEFKKMSEDSERKALLHFIETGYFPYSVFLESLPKKEIQKIFARVFNNESEINNLRKVIAKSFEDQGRREFKAVQFKRFLPDVIIKKYFSVFIKSTSVPQKSFENTNAVSLEEVNSFDAAVFFIQYFIKEKSLPGAATFTFDALVEKLVNINSNKSVAYFTLLKERERKIIQENISIERAAWIEKYVKELIDKINSIERRYQKESEDRDEIIETQEGALFKEEKAEEPLKVQMGDPIYINNAGLVIFNPYLPRFFKMLGLIEKRDFIDEYSAHKAAHILQYLADKSENKEEHDLTLNKLLCGIDLHLPLIRDIEITEEDKKTCDSLIEGVIQNWTILKSTSIDNFRISFLIREGRLVLEPQGWKLKVEERGYDILVEKIPWSISMIKLPWMKKMIYVEWK